MKKITLISAIMIFAITTSAQELVSITDEITGKKQIVVEKPLSFIDREANKALHIEPIAIHNYYFNCLFIRSYGLNDCNEYNTLEFLFKDGTVLEIGPDGDFNCNGEVIFFIKKQQMDLLASKPVDKVRFTNGRSLVDYTHQMSGDEGHYFIKLYENAETKTAKKK